MFLARYGQGLTQTTASWTRRVVCSSSRDIRVSSLICMRAANHRNPMSAKISLQNALSAIDDAMRRLKRIRGDVPSDAESVIRRAIRELEDAETDVQNALRQLRDH